MTTDLTRSFKEIVKARADKEPAFRAELWASLVIEERFLKRQWLKMREMLQSWKKLLADDTDQTQAK